MYTIYTLLVLFFQTCFDWFYKGQDDLDSETQSQMFTSKVLKLEPNRLTMKGTVTKGEVSFTGHIPQVTITGHCFIDSQVNQVISLQSKTAVWTRIRASRHFWSCLFIGSTVTFFSYFMQVLIASKNFWRKSTPMIIV